MLGRFEAVMTRSMLETDLYPPIESFLKKNGYTVHAEVLLSDISAVKGGELLVVEMKTRFNLEVLLQAVRRQEAADFVYIAVPVSAPKRFPSRWTDFKRICRRLGIGILLVRFPWSGDPVAESALDADPDAPCRKSRKLKASMLKEIGDRGHNFNVGGSTRKALMTAYRMQALKVAVILSKTEDLSPREIRERGGGEKTGSILQKNYYNWFARTDKGRYSITDEGRKALDIYREIVGGFD